MNSKELIEYLETWINIPNEYLGKPIIPFIHGRAGIGKTEIVEQLSKKHGKTLVPLNLSHQEEGDLVGIPDKVKRGEEVITVWSAPEWLGVNREKEVVLFLDEIDRAPKNILNTTLTLLREYRIHTHYFPKNWKIIAAGNSGFNDDFYDVQELDNALKTRFVHLFYELTTSEWLEWAKKNNIHPMVIKYLELNPNNLIVENTQDFTFAYPNPRTWQILSDNIKFIRNQELIKFISIGTIGYDIGISFYAFYKQNFNIKVYSFNELLHKWNEFKKEKKEVFVNTVININNNMNALIKSFEKKQFVNLISKLVAFLIFKGHYELAFSILSTIETNNQEYINYIYMLIERKFPEQFKKIADKIKKIKEFSD